MIANVHHIAADLDRRFSSQLEFLRLAVTFRLIESGVQMSDDDIE